jgi:hypothetical protein
MREIKVKLSLRKSSTHMDSGQLHALTAFPEEIAAIGLPIE